LTERADRLGAAVLLLGLVRQPAVEAVDAAAEVDLLTADEWDAWRSADETDLRIAHACLVAQYEQRAREWAALELVLADRPRMLAPAVAPSASGPAGPKGSASGFVTVPANEWEAAQRDAAYWAGVVADAERTLGWDRPAPEAS
jgi:hypothetical protein